MNEPAKPHTRLNRHSRNRCSHESLRARVSALIAHGTPLYAIARQRGLPNLATLRRWLAEDADLRLTYEQAHALREEYSADDAVMLADTLAAANNTGLKLRIDARKWGASLDRKYEKKPDMSADAKETLERLQRGFERVRKRQEEEERRQRQITAEGEHARGGAGDNER